MPREDPDPQAEPKPNRLTIIVLTVCTMLATLMQSLDSTIANVALPYMQGSMSASQDEINWVLTSYIIAAAIMTAPTGFLAARFGRTRIYLISILGFTLASVLCGMAQSLGQIVVFRFIQGLCGACLVPLSQSVLFDLYPMEKRGPAMAMWGMGVQIGPVMGPILGGWLTQNYDWRWVFYINVPVGVAAAAGILLFLKETSRAEAVRLDWIGFGALTLGVGALQLMLDRGETKDWFSSREVVVEAVLSGIGFYLFFVQSALVKKPFLSPKLFTDTNFVIGIIFIFLIGLVLYATLALLAPYLQTLMNYPVVLAGFVLAPRGLGTIVSQIICGRLIGRVSTRVLVAFGLAVSTYALYQMTVWTPDVSTFQIVSTGVLQGLGLGFVFVPLSVTSFATMPRELRTEAAGIFSLMRNLGSAIGISVTSALLQSNTQVNHAILAAVATPFNRIFQSGAGLLVNPATSQGAQLLNVEVTQQASVIAYADDFKLMFIMSLIALPLAFFLRSPEAPAVREAAPAMD